MTDFIVNPRRAPRAPSRCRVRVQGIDAAWDAETEDVGPHGCQLVAPAPLARGSALRLALTGPGVKEPLQARGRVAWVSSQPPWRLGVAFEDAARPAATRWFDQIVAARPGLGNFRRVPDRLPVDAMIFLAPPPRFADFNPDEVTVLRHVAGGVTIEAMRRRLAASWPMLQRALFALLSRGAVTVARGAAAHPESWRAVMAELGAAFVAEPSQPWDWPGFGASPPPPSRPASMASPAPLEPVDLPDQEALDPVAPPGPALRAPPDAPPTSGAPLLEAASPPTLPLQPVPSLAGPATAGTGWRGVGRTRSADAQEAFELGRQELKAGRSKVALALLRRALQLAPGDAEVAVELGRAMKG